MTTFTCPIGVGCRTCAEVESYVAAGNLTLRPASRSTAHSDLAGSGELRSRDETAPSTEAPDDASTSGPPAAASPRTAAGDLSLGLV